jgi:hypothetical protein
VENSKRQSSLTNRRGQAAVEYVLMLVVSVALLVALAYQVFRPMQEFLQDYMGSYIACLLETGELPSLGNSDSKDQLQAEGCDAKFKPATAKSGRPPADASSSSSDSSSSKDKSSSSSDSDSSKSGGGSSASSADASNGRNLLTRSGRRGGADGPKASDGKTTDIPIADPGSKFYNRRTDANSASGNAGRRTVLGGVGFTDDEKKKQTRKENSNNSMNLSDESGRKDKKISIQKPERKVAAEAEDEAMTFGNFFRFLLIAAIIIALVMVLGSQALKIVKSQEK